MVALWEPYGNRMGLLWESSESQGLSSNGSPLVALWEPDGNPLGSLWVPVGTRWKSDAKPLGILRVVPRKLYGRPMGTQLEPWGNPLVIPLESFGYGSFLNTSLALGE